VERSQSDINKSFKNIENKMSTRSQRMAIEVKKDARNSFERRLVFLRRGRKIELFVIGDAETGKSSICQSILNRSFTNKYFPTKKVISISLARR
jgi:GTPase SAR1 family protein